jgi:2-dehydro-3-deoxygalactonokinase
VLVPGVRSHGVTTMYTDVMRGEETLVMGMLATGLASPGAGVLNAGSHWKFIQIDAHGRIASSRTSLGGEVVHATATATLLASALPAGPLREVDEQWLLEGADATATHGLLRAMFAVRLLHLEGGTTPEQRHSFLVGATIAADVQALVYAGALTNQLPLVVTGPAAMAAAWVRLLRWQGFDAGALSADDLESAFLAGIAAILRGPVSLDVA